MSVQNNNIMYLCMYTVYIQHIHVYTNKCTYIHTYVYMTCHVKLHVYTVYLRRYAYTVYLRYTFIELTFIQIHVQHFLILCRRYTWRTHSHSTEHSRYLVPGTWYLCIYFQLLTIVQRPSKRIITVPGTLCFQLLTIAQRIITVVIFTGTTRLLRTLAQSIISLLI